MFLKKPIPRIDMPGEPETSAFRDEPLIAVSDYFGNTVFTEPMYFQQKIPGSVGDIKVRLSVAAMLERARQLLPDNLTFKIYDAYRPISVQQALWDKYYHQLVCEHADWSESKLISETKNFVSVPSYDIDCPSVHNTGGAVDLTLADKETGAVLSMGTEFDDFTEKAHTAYFETYEPINTEIRNNRRLLYWTMIHAGFTNLPSEWWHYDYGTAFWAYYMKRSAKYQGIL